MTLPRCNHNHHDTCTTHTKSPAPDEPMDDTIEIKTRRRYLERSVGALFALADLTITFFRFAHARDATTDENL